MRPTTRTIYATFAEGVAAPAPVGAEPAACRALSLRRLEQLRGHYAGETAYILTCGPSLEAVWNEELKEFLADKLVIACKQAYDLAPEICDFHLYNTVRLKDYDYPHETIRMSVWGYPASNPPHIHFPLRANHNYANSLIVTHDYERFGDLVAAYERPLGVGIMFEIGLFLPLLLGCSQTVIIGFDMNETGKYHFYRAEGEGDSRKYAREGECRQAQISSDFYWRWAERKGLRAWLYSPLTALMMPRLDTLEKVKAAHARGQALRALPAGRRKVPELAIATTAFLRPEMIRRFVVSAREHLPECAIHVAEQSAPEDGVNADFYRENGVNVLHVGFDAGLSKSRNATVKTITCPYILLCDDDVVFRPDTDPSLAIDLLERFPDLAFVGGRMRDIATAPDGTETARERHYEYLLSYHPEARFLSLLPAEIVGTQTRSVGGIPYIFSDVVLNFGVFRRSFFEETGLFWDEKIKIMREHIDFFLSVKQKTRFRVAYCPDLIIDHRRSMEGAYAAYRNRSDAEFYFHEKWGIDRLFELGSAGEGSAYLLDRGLRVSVFWSLARDPRATDDPTLGALKHRFPRAFRLAHGLARQLVGPGRKGM
jgi:GT2 family glycosyltransferase